MPTISKVKELQIFIISLKELHSNNVNNDGKAKRSRTKKRTS